jgi:hypothetical protein
LWSDLDATMSDLLPNKIACSWLKAIDLEQTKVSLAPPQFASGIDQEASMDQDVQENINMFTIFHESNY